uniref:Nuclear receptor domain-containing protein n=1 Tax=Panagrolaimus sp. ES5 TaxID=591445 RepID=A0AC34FU31_9BILA
MCVKAKTCKVCTREVIDDDDKFCDNCIDFFINYFENLEFQKCKNSDICVTVESVEILNCEQCRARKCLRSGMNLIELMGPLWAPQIPSEPVPVDPNFLENLAQSLKELSKN